ncbi:MAG: glycosyltransferase family 4 protein [Neisseriaceae bacterium]
MNKLLILVGSNSVHSIRFLNTLSNHFKKIVFISNAINRDLPQNIVTYRVNFKLTNIFAYKQIAEILREHQYINQNNNQSLINNGLTIHIHQANSYAYHTIKAINKFHIKAKIILTTWGSDILLLPQKSLFLKKMVQYNLNNADLITSDSLYMSSKIYELINYKNKDIRTINFGILELPQQLHPKQKENIILSNRLHKSLYQIDKIIDAFDKLIKESQFSNYKLVIAGAGEDTNKLKTLAKDLNLTDQEIIFTGMITYSELQEWYTKAKIFISVPKSDATSLSLLEAMAYGCYPILSNLPANLEWIINDLNGHICENVNTLHNDIKFVIESINNHEEYNQLISLNHQLIRNKADFEININKFLELYD